MAILGLGTDIVEVARIEKVYDRLGDAFAQRILTPSEMTHFKTLRFKARYLAKRFSVKEAASKALGTGIAKGVSFHDFTVVNDEYGKPSLLLSGQAAHFANALGVVQTHVSLSDEKCYAVAMVIFES